MTQQLDRRTRRRHTLIDSMTPESISKLFAALIDPSLHLNPAQRRLAEHLIADKTGTPLPAANRTKWYKSRPYKGPRPK